MDKLTRRIDYPFVHVHIVSRNKERNEENIRIFQLNKLHILCPTVTCTRVVRARISSLQQHSIQLAPGRHFKTNRNL
jgi:hypothetical protein